MSFNDTIKDLLGAVAPVIGTAIGGPVGGAAMATLSKTLLGEDDASPKQIEEALLKATPEQLAALKKVDNEFDVRMKELDIDLEKINQANTHSARQREIAVKDKIPAILAILLTVGFFGILTYMFFSPQDQYNNALMAMLGALGTAFLNIINYYFGSSAGSAKKNELLTRLK